jgi:23S rRNA pseudouridine1911/1915/1917 synthase
VLRGGDRLDVSALVLPVAPAIAEDSDGALAVLHEDPDLVVVSKEAGLPTLPRDASDTRALACRLVARYPELRSIGPPLEAGLVHRLDTMTSGILVAARTPEAHALLKDLWRYRRVEKTYVALVEGVVRESFTVLVPVAHDPRSAKRMTVGRQGRSAETRFRSLAAGARASLVLASLREGRRHQIRVHLRTAGHPVVADPLYAGLSKGGAPRLMLHAARIRFRLRDDAAPIDVVSPPPRDFVQVVARELGPRGVRALERVLGAPPRKR